MSSAPSRTTPLPRPPPSSPLTTSLDSLKVVLLMPRTLPPRVERLPCPSLRTRSASLRLSLPEPRHALEAGKAYQRAERKCKELVFSSGEDKKNQDRMTDLASKLQSKIKTYKQQIEEAEEIAALNLAKFRKAQQELEEVEERAKLAALL